MASDEIKVWDPLVRVFHWSLVLCFSIAYITEDDVMWLHEAAGYGVLGLVGFRSVWGIVGPRYARFSNFVYSPAIIKQFLHDTMRRLAPRYLGHNPAGGLMVVVLLVMLALTAWTGIEAHEPVNGGHASLSTPLLEAYAAAEREHEEHGVWGEIHEVLANLTLLLVFIHIAGVIVESVLHKENLVRAMITGRKRKE